MTFRSDHPFQVWDYDVSLQKLLLRSPVSPSQAYNLDIVFIGVRRLDIPTIMANGLEVAGPEPDGGEWSPSNFFRVSADGRDYRVVALACWAFKNQMDFQQSILGHMIGEGETEEMGEVLFRSTGPVRPSTVAGRPTG